jgi:hypothetical protein
MRWEKPAWTWIEREHFVSGLGRRKASMMLCSRRAFLLGSILVACFGTACDKHATVPDTPSGKTLPVPDAKLESGWSFHEVPSAGFALALPPDWRQFDMDPATFDAQFQEAMKRNPQFELMLGNLRQQMAAGMKFVGIHEATLNTGFATNVNVLRLQMPSGTTLDAAVAATLGQMESLPNFTKPIVHERLTMATGDRERIRCKMTMQMPTGQTFTLATTQFVLVKDTDAYAVTLTTLADQDAKYAPSFEKIGTSFRFIKSVGKE